MKVEVVTDFEFEGFRFEDQAPKRRSPVWRLAYAVIILLFIGILLFSMTGLSHWFVIRGLSPGDLRGETEAGILERFGEPDYRSAVQPFIPETGYGMIPQRLDEGEVFYSLNYVIGPRLYVFHFVSPETYTRHTGQQMPDNEWIVLEYYNEPRYIVY